MIMLEYKRYHAKLSFDENDNLIIGKLLGIKDEVGKTPDIPTTALTFSGQ